MPPQGCLIAGHQPLEQAWPAAKSVRVFHGAETTVVVDGKVAQGPRQVRFRVVERDFLVDAEGFWQPHVAAAEVLVAAVLAGVQVRAGESVVDLYCGVGLFAGAVAFNQSLSKWNFASLAQAGGMFAGATAFQQPLDSLKLPPNIDSADLRSLNK